MLLDEIRASLGQLPAFPPVLDVAVCFAVDDIARYLARTHVEGDTFEIPTAVPNAAPLAPAAWFEWSAHGPFGGLSASEGDQAAILMVTMLDRTEERTLQDASAFKDGRALLARFPSEARWCLHAYMCWHRRGHQDVAQLPDYAEFMVGADGSILDQRIGSPPGVPPMTDGIANVILTNCCVALTAMCFAHCKGVTVTEHQQPRQQRRAAERAGHPPLVTYKTIDIAPVRRILHDEGQVETGGLKRALHITRGHFAHYAPGHYFGRNTEPVTVFRPLHVRGTLEAGVVAKDYRVLAGEALGDRR